MKSLSLLFYICLQFLHIAPEVINSSESCGCNISRNETLGIYRVSLLDILQTQLSDEFITSEQLKNCTNNYNSCIFDESNSVSNPMVFISGKLF